MKYEIEGRRGGGKKKRRGQRRGGGKGEGWRKSGGRGWWGEDPRYLEENGQTDEVEEAKEKVAVDVVDAVELAEVLGGAQHCHEGQEPGVGLGEGPVQGHGLPEVVPDALQGRTEGVPLLVQPLQVLVVVEGEDGDQPPLLVGGEDGGAPHDGLVLVPGQAPDVAVEVDPVHGVLDASVDVRQVERTHSPGAGEGVVLLLTIRPHEALLVLLPELHGVSNLEEVVTGSRHVQQCLREGWSGQLSP